jgi:hypothetical protein
MSNQQLTPLVTGCANTPSSTPRRPSPATRSAPAISPRVTVSGHVHDVVTGLVETVLPARSSHDPTVEKTRPLQGDETP